MSKRLSANLDLILAVVLGICLFGFFGSVFARSHTEGVDCISIGSDDGRKYCDEFDHYVTVKGPSADAIFQ